VDIVRTGIAKAPVVSGDTRIKVKSVHGPYQASVAAPTVSGIDISKVAVGEAILLENIYFYAGRHIVRRESDEALNALVEALKANPKTKIRIEGHVCCVPASAKDALDDDTGREELSINRASVIRDYLIAHGIQADRLTYAGFGHTRPVIPIERTEDDANRNRRVEIRVVQ
jgi:outer membrane protein OmpA-like peptidoglycan-associated protein